MKSAFLVLWLMLTTSEVARPQNAPQTWLADDDSVERPALSGTAKANSTSIPAIAGRIAAAFLPRETGFEVVHAPARSWAVPSTTTGEAANASADPIPAPPNPRFVYGSRDDFRWQLGLGISLVRFRSSLYYATGVGTDTSVTYFTNEWLGFEGRITTSFAGTIYQSERVKYLGYGGGPKLAWRAQKFEPFIHGLAGGAHILPQTPLGSQNAAAFQVGGGAGYRFNPRLSTRITVDYVRTHFFGMWQNNAQATL